MQPWCQSLKDCFNTDYLKALRLSSSSSSISTSLPLEESSSAFPLDIFGSPMLDVALGRVDATLKVWEAMGGKANKSSSFAADQNQFDANLPPELPTDWVQCEACDK